MRLTEQYRLYIVYSDLTMCGRWQAVQFALRKRTCDLAISICIPSPTCSAYPTTIALVETKKVTSVPSSNRNV